MAALILILSVLAGFGFGFSLCGIFPAWVGVVSFLILGYFVFRVAKACYEA